MKILVFSNCELDPSLGSGKTHLRWSEGLKTLGHQVDVVTPKQFRKLHWPKADQVKFSIDALVGGLKSHWRDYDLIEIFGGNFGWLTGTFKTLRKGNRPLIVAHADGLELLASKVARKVDPKKYKKIFHRLTTPLYDSINRMHFSFADGFVCLSQEDLSFFRSFPEHAKIPSIAIAPGLDSEFLERPFKIPPPTLHIAFVGTWSSRKAPERIARVVSSVLEKSQKAEFHIFGASAQKGLVLNSFSEKLWPRIVVYPKLPADEMVRLLSKCRLLFFPSHNEGFGMALSEAMACSLPVVTTPTGLGYDLKDGEDAIVCDFQDEEKMISSILQLLTNDVLHLKIAKNGWKRVQTLSWETQVKQLESTYLEWLK